MHPGIVAENLLSASISNARVWASSQTRCTYSLDTRYLFKGDDGIRPTSTLVERDLYALPAPGP